MKKLIILLIHLFLIFTFSYGEILETELFQPGTEIQGFIRGRDAYFFVEKNWKFDADPEVQLSMAVSNITKFDKSSLTYSINDKPILSSQMTIKEQNGNLDVLVSIPRMFIKQGINKFTIEKIQLITDLECNFDEISPANWIRIDKSFMSANYFEDNSDVTLSSFPFPIVNQYEFSKKKNINIMLHDNPTEGEKLTLANISAYIGKKNLDTTSPINIINTKNMDNFTDNYLIVSEFSKLPDKLKNMFTESEKLISNTGLTFKLIDNPNNMHKKIIIVTGTPRVLNFGANQLFDEDLMKQVTGNFAVLQYEENVQKSLKDLGEIKFMFKDFGYDNLLISGIGKNSNYLALPLPKDKQYDKLILNLRLKFSELVRGNNSTLKILLNGVSIWDKTFDNNSESFIADIPIPPEFYNSSKLSFEFQGNIVTKLDCNSAANPWILVENYSSISGTYKNKEQFSLMDFPAPFIKDKTFNDLSIAVSDDFRSLKFMSELFRLMGQTVNYATPLSYTNSYNAEKNSIIIGNPSDNKALADLKAGHNLFIDYNRDNTKFINSIKFQFLGSNIYSAIGFIPQVKASHLVIFTDDKRYYDNVLDKFKKNDFTTNSYLGINMNEGIDLGSPIAPVEVKKETDVKNIEVIRIFIVILVIFAGFLLYLFRKNRDKNEDKK